MKTGQALCSKVVWTGVARRLAKALPLVYAATLVACADKPELPEGWEDAQEIPVTATECENSGELDAESTFSFELSEDESSVDALYAAALYRCSQEVCAYHLEEDGVAKVLTQPCEMHPEVVPKCSCVYDLEFTFDAPASGEVEIWHGSDAHGGPAEQRLVHEGPVDSPAEE